MPSKRIGKRLKKLSSKFMGSVDILSNLHGQYRGYKFGLSLRSDHMKFRLFSKRSFEQKICIYSRSCGPVLFMKRVWSKYQDTNNQLYIYSDHPEAASDFLSQKNRHAALKQLLESGIINGPAKLGSDNLPLKKELTTIKIDRNEVNMTIKYQEPNLNESFISDTLSKMITLSDELRA